MTRVRVTERARRLEPATADPFIDDLPPERDRPDTEVLSSRCITTISTPSSKASMPSG